MSDPDFHRQWADFYEDVDDVAVSLGLEPVSADDEHVHLRMPLRPPIRQIAGMFSAASLFGLADVCATWLAMRHVPQGRFPLLVQSSTNLIANTSEGYAHAVATLVKVGRTLVVAQVRVTDDTDRVLAVVTNTMVPR